MTPSDSISFAVISYMYGACFALCIMFYVLEHFLIMLDKDHWAADNLDQVKGIYVIFLPFFPCLLWSLNMARIQKRDGVKVKDD